MSSFHFSTFSCTSEEQANPFSNLLKESSNAGWVSNPNPRFPITIIINLHGKFLIRGLEIVSHESMIASKVELYATIDETITGNTYWDDIGFFSFHDNQRSQWRAREFKNININNIHATYLQFVVSKNHQVPSNTFNQVSFVSLKIKGTPRPHPKMTTFEEMIHDLSQTKLRHIQMENFTLAEEIKQQIENAMQFEPELRELLLRKEQAMLNEQYLTVDNLVNKISAVIAGDYNDRLPSSTPEYQPPPQDDYSAFLTEQIQTAPEDDYAQESEPEQKTEREPTPPYHEEEIYEEPEPEPEPVPPPKESPKHTPKAKKVKKERIPKSLESGPDAPPDVSGNEDIDPLADDAKLESELLIEKFGEKVLSMAYSRGWSVKVQGYGQLCELMKGLKGDDFMKEEAIHAMVPLIRRHFNDNLKAVYVSAINSTIEMMDSLKLPSATISIIVHQIMPIPLSRLGDTNQRIAEASKSFVSWCAQRDKFALNEVIQYTLKPPPSPNQYNIILSKLTFMDEIIRQHGTGGKLKITEIMKIVVPNLESRKAEVRQKATDIIVFLSPQIGKKLDNYIADIPRIVRDQLKAAIAKG